MRCAIIDYKPGFSKLDQTIFLKKTLKKCKTEIKENHILIQKYNLPIYEEHPSKKAVHKFCEFLKQENVLYIYVTEAVKQIPWAYQILEKNFSFFKGIPLINYKTCDIIRKYAGIKGKKLSESSIILETDEPKKAEDVIGQIYRRVKKISIKTRFEERFSILCDYLLKEYGLFVALNETEDHDLHIELDQVPVPTGHLNLSDDENSASKIIFTLQNKKEYDQFYLEFLIYFQFGQLNKKIIKEFFNQYSVRISKIL